MKSTTTLQVDTDVLLKLVRQLHIRGGAQDLSEAVTSAIELWLAEQARLQAGADPASVRGYQWKTLFLPEGTVLRSWSYGENNHARVEGDQIVHDGRSVSPNEFAQSFARSTRNAWTDLYIRRPADKQFMLASRLRRELAEQARQPKPVPEAVPSAASAVASPLPDATTLALAAALQTLNRSPAAQVAPPAPPRDTTPGPGWNLPERRKFRYRLEDVAFE
jgi:hypothetical protein